MELTKKELAYLELYKGIEEGIGVLRPDIEESMYWYYAVDYNYKYINLLTTFIFTKDSNLLDKLFVTNIDNAIDMIFTLSDVACRYALENPVMPYHLYRIENKNNKNNYGEGNITLSFKSTSKSKSEVGVFKYEDTMGISIDTNGFVPYIDVDNIVRTSVFSDEKEILFPPFIGSIVSGNNEEIYGTSFSNVILTDEYTDTYDNGYKEAYESIKNKFASELMKCQKDKTVSEDLETYCSIIGSYMFSTLRNMYNNYNVEYRKANEMYFS